MGDAGKKGGRKGERNRAGKGEGESGEGEKGLTTIAQLRQMPAEQRARELTGLGLEESEVSDVECFLRVFPQPEIRVRYLVNGKNPSEGQGSAVKGEGRRGKAVDKAAVMFAGANASFLVELTLAHRMALPAKSMELPAHAPWYPHAKKETWVIVLCEARGGRVLAISPVPPAVLRTPQTMELKVRFENPGSHSLEVLAICTAYLGADVRSDLNVEILEPAKNMKKKSAQGGRGGESDSDDDSSDEYDDESSEGSDASE